MLSCLQTRPPISLLKFQWPAPATYAREMIYLPRHLVQDDQVTGLIMPAQGDTVRPPSAAAGALAPLLCNPYNYVAPTPLGINATDEEILDRPGPALQRMRHSPPKCRPEDC